MKSHTTNESVTCAQNQTQMASVLSAVLIYVFEEINSAVDISQHLV